ncbi:MAG: acylphosphatase [Phycisphaerae bacterium]
MKIRRTTYFSGNVQGVGFRYISQAIAAAFEVSGFVRNLPDGRVELVAEGELDEIERFHLALSQKMGTNIAEAMSTDGTFLGEYADFSIRC